MESGETDIGSSVQLTICSATASLRPAVAWAARPRATSC